METQKIVYGETEDEILDQLAADFEAETNLFQYSVLIEQAGRKIFLVLDIDPGGGFEGGYETTTLTAPLQTVPNFSFAVHHEGLLDEIGKFFGMQDVATGYPEFDKKVVVKTNDEERVRSLFESPEVRTAFGLLTGFSLGITRHHTSDEKKTAFLEFSIDRGILDFKELRSIYSAFSKVLSDIDPQ